MRGCCLAEFACTVFAFRILVRMQLERELLVRSFHLRVFVGEKRASWQKGSADAASFARPYHDEHAPAKLTPLALNQAE
jgi:hypothetical protein